MGYYRLFSTIEAAQYNNSVDEVLEVLKHSYNFFIITDNVICFGDGDKEMQTANMIDSMTGVVKKGQWVVYDSSIGPVIVLSDEKFRQNYAYEE